jgi:hypothetical protein
MSREDGKREETEVRLQWRKRKGKLDHPEDGERKEKRRSSTTPRIAREKIDETRPPRGWWEKEEKRRSSTTPRIAREKIDQRKRREEKLDHPEDSERKRGETEKLDYPEDSERKDRRSSTTPRMVRKKRRNGEARLPRR